MIPIRNDTQEALRLLNFISDELSGGGTFYGHMLERSEGEMEHSLYKYEHGGVLILVQLVWIKSSAHCFGNGRRTYTIQL